MVSVPQIKAARALLGMTQAELAHQAKLSLATLNNIEREAVAPRTSSLDAIQSALEAAGIEFIPENGGGAGVRLRERQKPKP